MSANYKKLGEICHTDWIFLTENLVVTNGFVRV